MGNSALSTAGWLALSATAAYFILGLQVRSGFFDALAALEHARKPALSPDEPAVVYAALSTGKPMRTRFTGLAALDAHLGSLLRFFWPVVSAELPALSLFGVWFAGQILAVHTIIVLEGLRAGNARRLVSFSTTWGLVYQSIPFGIIMPVWAAVYLRTSPLSHLTPATPPALARAALSADPTRLLALPAALALGYLLPTALAALPSPRLVSPDARQLLLVAWQAFPLWVALAHELLSRLARALPPPPPASAPRSAAARARLRLAYRLVLSLAATSHLLAVAVAVAPRLVLPAALRPRAGGEALAFGTVFVPSPRAAAPARSLAHGCLALLQWDAYFGAGAALVWAAVVVARQAGAGVWGVLGRALGVGVGAGPGAAALWLVWERDERCWADEGAAAVRAKKA